MSVEDAAVLATETEQVNNSSEVTLGAEQTPASTQPAKEGEDEHDQPGREGGYQRIKRQRDEARAREEYWRDRAQNASPKTQPAPAATEVEEVAPKKPKATDFATVDELLAAQDAYLEERLAYEQKQIVKAVKADLSKTEEQKTAERQQRERLDAHFEREKQFAEANPQYQKVKDADIKISGAMKEAILESEDGPAIALYLAEHPEEAEAIRQMAPLTAARAMGKIEASLAKPSSATEEVEKPIPPLKTAAPTPPTPVRRNSSAAPEPDMEKLAADDFKGYVKLREAQTKRK